MSEYSLTFQDETQSVAMSAAAAESLSIQLTGAQPPIVPGWIQQALQYYGKCTVYGPLGKAVIQNTRRL